MSPEIPNPEPPAEPRSTAAPGPGREPVGGGGAGVVPLLLSSPTEAFQRLGADPKWLGLVVLCAVLFALASWLALPQILEAQSEMMLQVVERFDLPEEQADQMMADLPDPENVTAGVLLQNVGGGVLSTLVGLFVGVLVFHLIARISGPDPSFRQSSAVYWLAAVASGFGALVKSLLVRLSDSVEVTLGPGALLPGLEARSFLWNVLDLFDVFSLLHLFLLATGVAVVLGTSRGTAWGIGGAYWILKSLFVFAFLLFQSWVTGSV